MAATNTLKARLAEGKVAVGVSCGSGSVHAAELSARAGLDYVYLDMQHGLTSFDVLHNQLRGFSGTTTTPLVRVLRNDAGLIGQVLGPAAVTTPTAFAAGGHCGPHSVWVAILRT
jgi:4-hydroxy-2-oxoheptanedioate aldolase